MFGGGSRVGVKMLLQGEGSSGFISSVFLIRIGETGEIQNNFVYRGEGCQCW